MGSARVVVMQDVVADTDAAMLGMRYVSTPVAKSEGKQSWRQVDREAGQCPRCWLVVRRALRRRSEGEWAGNKGAVTCHAPATRRSQSPSRVAESQTAPQMVKSRHSVYRSGNHVTTCIHFSKGVDIATHGHCMVLRLYRHSNAFPLHSAYMLNISFQPSMHRVE